MDKTLFDLNGHPMRRRKAKRDRWGLNEGVIKLAKDAVLAWRDLFDVIAVFGGPGSGKTSSSMEVIAETVLRRGAGALLLTTKSSDGRDQREMVRRAGREQDLIVIRPGGPNRINVLDYAARYLTAGAGGIEEVASLMRAAICAVDGDGGRAQVGEAIWDRARDDMIRFGTAVLLAAGEEVSIINLAKLVMSAPATPAELARLERLLAEGGSPGSFFGKCLQQALASADANGVDVYTQDALIDYWTLEYPRLPDRTQGSVRFSFSSVANALRIGDLAELCTTTTTISLAACRTEGKIIQIDLPPRSYGQAGRMIQALIKHIWEKEMERRSYGPEERNVRPQLLQIDECQVHLNSEDVQIFSTTRSARVCVLIASQSLAAVRQKIGADATEQLLGTVQQVVVHSCSGETAQWMATQIGEDWGYRASMGGDGSVSFSEEKRYLVEPIEFSKLARGGKEHGYICEAYVFKPGARWGPEGRNYLKVRFPQRRAK